MLGIVRVAYKDTALFLFLGLVCGGVRFCLGLGRREEEEVALELDCSEYSCYLEKFRVIIIKGGY